MSKLLNFQQNEDGNFKIVKGVVRGNKNTLELKLAKPVEGSNK